MNDKVVSLFPTEARDSTPPHNYEAEQGLLGALLVNNAAFERLPSALRAEHFADPAHGRIFDAIGKLIERGQIANPITLKALFDQDDGLADVGGFQYLVKLAASVVAIVNAEDYGRTVHDLALRRQLQAVGEAIIADAGKATLDRTAYDVASDAELRLAYAIEGEETTTGYQSIAGATDTYLAAAEAAFKRGGKIGGVSTGLACLDYALGGLHPSDLIVLAARPGMGKTALAGNIAVAAAEAALAAEPENLSIVIFFSLEMSADQISGRLLSTRTGIATEQVRRGDINSEQMADLVKASVWLKGLPLVIDDTPSLSVQQMRARALRLKRRQRSNIALVIVDYLQLATTQGRTENRVQEVSEISRALKAMAKDLGCPVLAGSQLSRAVEQREDKRPQLSDLRESGSIEQDADVVMFLYREEYYLGRDEPHARAGESDSDFAARRRAWDQRLMECRGNAEIGLGKNRHGVAGRNLVVRFDGRRQQFSDGEAA